MIHCGVYKRIFAWFESELERHGIKAQREQMIDATFVQTHKPTGKDKAASRRASFAPFARALN